MRDLRQKENQTIQNVPRNHGTHRQRDPHRDHSRIERQLGPVDVDQRQFERQGNYRIV